MNHQPLSYHTCTKLICIITHSYRLFSLVLFFTLLITGTITQSFMLRRNSQELCSSCGDFFIPRCDDPRGSQFCSASINCTGIDTRCHTSLYLPRPQGLDSAAFFDNYYYRHSPKVPCGLLSIGYRYNHTFREENISRCLFGHNTLTFKGALARHRHQRDLLADNFGLDPHFSQKIRFHPTIQNHLVDFMGIYQLGPRLSFCQNSFIRIQATVAHTSWDLDPQRAPFESAGFITNQDTILPTCEVSSTDVPAAHSLNQALSGNFLFGDLNEPWEFGRFVLNSAQTKTGLASFDILLGYDLWRCETHHLGVFLKISPPTGNRPDARTIFEPIVGNGHHWEFGGGFDAHAELWSSGYDQSIIGFVGGNVTHLFNDTQKRSLDFSSSNIQPGCLSRYMLLKEFDENREYTGVLKNAINLTTRTVESSFTVQGDAYLRAVLFLQEWALGIGYNIYGRSHEHLDVAPFTQEEINRFGIKGTAGVCARQIDNNNQVTGETRTLNATQSQARARVAPVASVNNATVLPGFITWESPTTPPSDSIIAQESERDNQPAPVLITSINQLKRRGVPSQITHKFFATVDYQWDSITCPSYQPAIQTGVFVEVAEDRTCKVCTPNQWGLWLKATASF